MTTDKDLQTLTEKLGLSYERQDWGIVNADAARVREFMRFCQTGSLTPPQQYAMGELILASMNEALAEGIADDDTIGEFKRFLMSDLHGLPAQIRYWSSLGNHEEFPLSEFLGHKVSV